MWDGVQPFFLVLYLLYNPCGTAMWPAYMYDKDGGREPELGGDRDFEDRRRFEGLDLWDIFWDLRPESGVECFDGLLSRFWQKKKPLGTIWTSRLRVTAVLLKSG